MQVVEYSRSYLFFTAKGRSNTARLQVEARCELFGPMTDARDVFFFFASCKAEHTHVAGPLFQNPNYDFCGAFSDRDFAIFRTPAWHETDQHTRGSIESTFDSVREIIHWQEASALETRAAISNATLAGTPLVGRTEWEMEDSGIRVRLEYPIKTMNVHPETAQYQIDTGPLPFPDASPPGARGVERLVPAFVAWNTPDRAEFILQRPTPVTRDGREIGRVLHYSEIRALSVKNAVLGVAASRG